MPNSNRQKQARWLSIAIGICVFLIIVLLAFVFGKDFIYHRYTNIDAGFSISYPWGWTYKENVMKAPVVFLSPKENALDFFQENFNIQVQDLADKPTNLAAYSEMATHQVEVVFQ